VWLIRRIRDERSWAGRQFVLVAVGLPLLLFMFSWLLAGVIGGARGPEAIGAALKQIGVDTSEAGVRTALGRRLLHPWTALLLGGGVAAVWLLVRRPPQPIKRSEGHPDAVPTWPFAALLVGVGGLLVLGPEFVYLKDFFGTRMNTIFKFYYAAWLLWGVAAAYATYDLWPRMGESGVARLQALIVLPLAIGLFYPVMSLTTRTQGFSPPAGRTLDGTAYLQRDDPADAQAIDWLNDHELTGVVAEAVGGSYSQYARIATHTGLTTVLGWEFHEVQWRGSVDPQGTRNADIESLFRSRSWPQARQVLERYGIDYVYVGPLERSTYGIVRTNLFNAFMTPIYDQGDVVIYQRIDQGRVP
jgi:YYY domain-containing protein